MLAKCEGEIQVELIDKSGCRVTEDLSDYRIEVRSSCIIHQTIIRLRGPTGTGMGGRVSKIPDSLSVSLHMKLGNLPQGRDRC